MNFGENPLPGPGENNREENPEQQPQAIPVPDPDMSATSYSEALRNLSETLPGLSASRGRDIVASDVERFRDIEHLNHFQGEIRVEGDFIASSKAGQRRRRGPATTPVHEAELADLALYVEPDDFQTGVDLLAEQRIVVFAGPARTGRRARALATGVAVLRRKQLPLQVLELRGDLLGNPSWRVPRGGAVMLVVDRPSGGRQRADAIDDKWLESTAEKLREQGSYLVVVTVRPRGVLATATKRNDHVLEDLELPDPLEVVRTRLLAAVPWFSPDAFDGLVAATALDEVLDERGDPRFATRAAKALGEALLADGDPADALARLRDVREQVAEWLGGDPTATELALVFATAVLEGSTYLSVVDSAVALCGKLGGSTGISAPRYARTLLAERSWIEQDRTGGGPGVLRFRHADLRHAVLTGVWVDLDGIRDKLLGWLTELAQHPDVEVRARAASAAGSLVSCDFTHGLYRVLMPWASSGQATLRHSASLGLNAAGGLSGDAEPVWRHLQEWVELPGEGSTVRRLAATAGLAAGGLIGAAEPERALRVLLALALQSGWGAVPSVAEGVRALVEAGAVAPVLEALLLWSEGDTGAELPVKALTAFVHVVRDAGFPLATSGSHPDVLPELWGRALEREEVADSAADALRGRVLALDHTPDPGVEEAVLDLLGGIAERGPGDYGRLCHLLDRWAHDADHPSSAAADVLEQLVKAGEDLA
ncbi:hypothetical protein KCV87_04850 [Actinosynnema pretiosum subsp. pretiosum]|uniref:LigA protein n=1 Tax=Actinosynnema pretiosum subsp. pretiosum TaxID=103721 RepID=A0AA45L941_9PSEU|nr:hypothetical protein APASM_3052 [Actinosynnema pretiosum subsp. pretiosum]QUF05435.1 hypothetical protein KCV87_04850 [Actinosynnema pretiosum subsp. pretiosum]